MYTCKNCNSEFVGDFCNSCGEKKYLDSDFKIKNILSQAFGAITNLDSKVLKTFKLLVQNPGILTKNYVNGVRVPYLKPFQIFLICNILFFIFLSDTDLFRTPSKWFFNQNFDLYGTKVMSEVDRVMQSNSMTMDEVRIKYDNISSDLSKSLLILLIPFIALIGVLIKVKLGFGKHLIFATHIFSLILFWITILYLITTNLPVPNKWFFILPVILVSLVYYIRAIKTFYEKNILKSILYGLVGIVMLAVFIGFYRNFINILSLKLL